MRRISQLSILFVLFCTGIPNAGAAIPLLYSTDMAHPYGDPDDQFDLAALFSIRKFDIKGVILDTRPNMQSQKPGTAPLSQMIKITGRSVPYAIGLDSGFANRTDACINHAAQYQGGVNLILSQLRDATEKVTVVITGSCRDLAAAFNRDPQLLLDKVKVIYLNAGNGPDGIQDEHNVAVEPLAYQRLFESGLPIRWLPCRGTGGYQTYYRANQQAIINAGILPVQKYFEYCLTKSTDDPIEYLSSSDQIQKFSGLRNMWSTVSFIEAAGLNIYNRGRNNYVALSPADAAEVGLIDSHITVYQFVPMQAVINTDGSLQVTLNPPQVTKCSVFQVTNIRYAEIMASVLKNMVSRCAMAPCR